MFLALLGIALFLPWLGARDLWNPDEPRYAEVAREMSVDGSYLVPHLNGATYAQKPPLFFWSIDAAALALGRFDEWAVRLPSALAALGTVLVVRGLGQRLFDARVGRIAALVYATCFKVLWQARVAQIDMLLSFLVALSAWFWVRGYQESRRADYRLFFLTAGFATLAKGPVGLLPFLLSALAFLWLSDGRREIRNLHLGRGLLLWAAPVVAWLAAATLQAGAGYLREIVLTQNLTRYFSPGSTSSMSGHLSPWYHYLTTLPVDFLPWSALLPAAFWVPAREGSWRRHPGFRLAVCWTLVPLLFFSLSAAKRSVYLLPLFPAPALLVAHLIDTVDRTGRRHRLAVSLPLGSIAALFLAVAAILPFDASLRSDLTAFGADVPGILSVLLALVGLAAAAGAWTASRGKVVPAGLLLALGMAPLGPLALGRLLPRADPVKSARPAAEALLARLGPDEEYAVFPRIDGRTLFYTRRLAKVLPDGAALGRYASENGRWVVAHLGDLAELDDPPPFETVASPGGDEGVALLRLTRTETER